VGTRRTNPIAHHDSDGHGYCCAYQHTDTNDHAYRNSNSFSNQFNHTHGRAH
jgi:hypothetical protein